MKDFVHRHLDPADRLGEILFGLIMALGFTAAVRLGREEADNRELFVGILGCNVAWGIVDGVMYVLAALFERSRRARITRGVLEAPTDEAARHVVARELDDRLLPLLTEDEVRHVHDWTVELARREGPQPVRVRAEDLLGGAAVGLVILAATAPMLAPYLLFADPALAVRLSHAIGLGLLFFVGYGWGRRAGVSPWGVGLGVTLVGMVLVGITVALGG